MRIWTIWVQADTATWLEGAWDDESTAENRSGYDEAVDKADKIARENGGAMRVIAVDIPDAAVFGAFDAPVVGGTVDFDA